jgi:hypothetical protein
MRRRSLERPISLLWLIGLLVSAGFASADAAQRNGQPRQAMPIDPIDAIIDAFHSHQIVAMTDGASSHGDEQNHAFRLSLIRDPRFAAAVNDIVVEFGSAEYQNLMDRFVSGEDVPYDALRHVWQDTSTPGPTWDGPIYEEFFRAVRAVNTSLPRERQLRVLLAGAAFDWDHLATARAHMAVFNYPLFQRDLLQEQVFARNRRAFVVFGLGHLRRTYRDRQCQPVNVSPDWLGFRNKRIFTIFQIAHDTLTSLQPDAKWPVPSLAVLRGTSIGAQADPSTFCAIGQDRAAATQTRSSSFIRFEAQFDAVLYLGNRESVSRISATRCADPEYMKMRLSRMAAFNMPDGIARLQTHCAAEGQQ